MGYLNKKKGIMKMNHALYVLKHEKKEIKHELKLIKTSLKSNPDHPNKIDFESLVKLDTKRIKQLKKAIKTLKCCNNDKTYETMWKTLKKSIEQYRKENEENELRTNVTIDMVYELIQTTMSYIEKENEEDEWDTI